MNSYANATIGNPNIVDSGGATHRFGSSTLWGNKRGLQNHGPNGVNYHKKLKDEFDRFDRYIKEQHSEH